MSINIDAYAPLIHRISHRLYTHPKVVDDAAVDRDDVLQQCYAEAIDIASYYREGGVSARMWMQVNLENRMSRWARGLGTVATAPMCDDSEVDEADAEPLYEDDPSVRVDAARILTMLPRENADVLRLLFGVGMEQALSLPEIAKATGKSLPEARRYTFHTINMARALAGERES